MKAGDLRPIGRDTQGVRLMDLAEGDRLVSIATLSELDVEVTSATEPAGETEPPDDDPTKAST